MKKILLAVFVLMLALPIYAQDAPIEAIPVCSEDEMNLIPRLLVDSGFLLDYALVSLGPIADDGTVDYLPSIIEMLAVRDVWVEAIVPNLPHCVQTVELQILLGDYIDQSLIQMMAGTISNPADANFADRVNIEMARVQGFEFEVGLMFETLFADIDIETALREQMEAREDSE